MKFKIIISFLAVFLLFVSGVVITLYIVNKTTSNLDSLLSLHKVEIIRQDLVINVQNVQSNLYTAGTLFGKELDVIVDNVLRLQDRVYTCTDCHHEPDVENDLLTLQEMTEQYKEALSYFITSTADKKRIERLQAVAADIGDMIIASSQEMAMAANDTLHRRTLEAQEKIKISKRILGITLAFSLAVIIVIALYLTKSITKPVSALLDATRRIRQGDLGYTYLYKGQDEFRELVESFNTMSHGLLENNERILSHVQRHQKILQTSTDGFVLVNAAGVVIDVNPAICDMTKYSAKDLPGMHFSELVEPEDAFTRKSLLDRIKLSGSIIAPVNLKSREGKLVAAEISASYAELDNRESYFCFIRDITGRKKMEEELHKGQKLESLGVLAGGIAHDFNNLLTGILGYIDLAMKAMAPGDKIHVWLESAKKASVRAQNLTQQLLTFAKGGEPVKQLVSVRELVDDATSFVLSGSNVKCEYRYSGDLWSVSADRGQIGQVVQNITLNGVQSMNSGGTITVQVENVVVEEGSNIRLVPGDYVKIMFTDQGVGISKRDLEKIFDPYYSTKPDGNGLGLTICHSIVRKHRGTITVDSKPGSGTTFAIYLPAQRKTEATADLEESGGIVEGSGRVLIMDDEQQVLEIVGEMLAHIGYEPELAKDGEETLELYKQAMHNGMPYVAVIMDLTIPGGMGGKETITKLLQVDPSARVIVSSGYFNDPVMSEYQAYGFRGVASKPYDIEQLSKTLHNVIAT